MKKIFILFLICPLFAFSQLDTVKVGAYARDPQADNIREAFLKVNQAILVLNEVTLFDDDSLFNILSSEIGLLTGDVADLYSEISDLKDSISLLRSDLQGIEIFLWTILDQLVISLSHPDSLVPLTYSTNITWRWTSVFLADGYIFSTTSDKLDGATVDTNYFIEDNLSCETSYTRYIWAYNEDGESDSLVLTASTKTCFDCGDSLEIEHIAGAVSPVTKSVTYHTIDDIPGEETKCWITQNLGSANPPATATDSTEAAAGWYWQFNQKQGYRYTASRVPSSEWIISISGFSDWLADNDPCSIELGVEWRIPTVTEWDNVDDAGSWTNYNGPFNSDLAIHTSGRIDSYYGMLIERGQRGYYWSSSMTGSSTLAHSLFFNSSNCYTTSNYVKSFGFSIRCLHE